MFACFVLDNIHFLFHLDKILIHLGKVRFTPSKYHKNLIFNLQLRNRITETIQLLKLGKFGPLLISKVVFHFFENYKYSNLN